MINCGIIGYGKMGRIRAAALQKSGQARIGSIYDPACTPLPPQSRRANAPDDIMADKQIDAVIICTPNDLNEPLTIQALNAGKHVFCEKPPAFNAAGVARIREAEAQSGRTLMYGFNHRHHDSIKAMKQIVEQGSMGRILWMRGRYGKEVDESFFTGWRADKARAGGGIMLDQGIHMLDLLIHLSGGFNDVQAMVSNLFWKDCDIEDNAFVNLRSSKTGICASLHSTMTQWGYLFSLEVFLEGGALLLSGLKTSSGAYGEETLTIRHKKTKGLSTMAFDENQIDYQEDNSWNSEMDHFLRCIQENCPVTYGSSQDALNVMQLIDRIYAADHEWHAAC